MNSDILSLSNSCVYNNKMICANEFVASKPFNISPSDLGFLVNNKKIKHYVPYILNPNKPVIFVDYEQYVKYTDPEFFNVKTEFNEKESQIVYNIICGLNTIKYNMKEVGVITPYRSQEQHLQSKCSDLNFYNIYTIDKSQGIEKEIIIISFVKTNERSKILKEIERINVAFTRPRSKLIIIGIKTELEKIDKLKDYINVIKNNNWIYQINDI